MVRLLDVDPDLGVLLVDTRRDQAERELVVRTHRLPVGPWDVSRLAGATADHGTVTSPSRHRDRPSTGQPAVLIAVSAARHRCSGPKLDAATARRLLEGRVRGADGSDDEAPEVRARRAATSSGSMAAIRANGQAYDAIFLDREKVIWQWPDIGGRAIEELR